MRQRDPLSDPRVHVILNDARSALRLTKRRYDAIVSQPSHPWTAGASHLYTREFVQLAHQHLSPNGVFVQWMNVIFMDEDLLRSLTATLLEVFTEVRVYRPDPNTMVFLASDAPLDLEGQVARTGLPLRDAPQHYARFGINNAEDLVAALALDTNGAREMAVGAALITDDDNRIATSSVFETSQGMTAETSGSTLGGKDPLQNPESEVFRNLAGELSFPYLVRRVGQFQRIDPSVTERVRRLAGILGESAQGEYARAFFIRMQRQPQRADQMLRLAIDQYPSDESLRQEYLRDQLDDLALGQAHPRPTKSRQPLPGLQRRCSLPKGMPRTPNGWRLPGPIRSWPGFNGPRPGIPKPWSCASIGGRESPDPNRRAGLRRSRSR